MKPIEEKDRLIYNRQKINKLKKEKNSCLGLREMEANTVKRKGRDK